jgi:hypothetical protein
VPANILEHKEHAIDIGEHAAFAIHGDKLHFARCQIAYLRNSGEALRNTVNARCPVTRGLLRLLARLAMTGSPVIASVTKQSG